MTAAATGVFRSLRSFNYRVWTAGACISNVGTWMQRTAQDWLVLTELTHHKASAVGVVMALQFGPQLLLLPWTGFAADHYNQRRLLMVTQATMGALALGLGVLTVTGVVQLWHVDVFAFLFGCAAAFDAPVHQTFVGELVGEADLSNAVALNSTSFNAARMIGPAVAGLVIASVGTGWAFVINGASFVAVLASMSLFRISELRAHARAPRTKGGFTEGFHYVWSRPDLKAILVMLFLIGTFGLNFPIFISTMAVGVFHTDARGYGLLSSTLAIGTISGALVAAGRDTPRFMSLFIGALTFGLGCTLAAIAPSYWMFAGALVIIGMAALTFTNTTNSLMQLSTEPAMRGRVMALRLGIALGCTPIGAPIVGWIADHPGPRWSLGVGAAAGFAAAIVAAYTLTQQVHRPYGLDGAHLPRGIWQDILTVGNRQHGQFLQQPPGSRRGRENAACDAKHQGCHATTHAGHHAQDAADGEGNGGGNQIASGGFCETQDGLIERIDAGMPVKGRVKGRGAARR